MGVGVLVGVSGPARAQSESTAAAPVVTGWEQVQSPSETDSRFYKTAEAKCPSGKKVVGGGGWVVEDGPDETAPSGWR
ncbi:hypothetical protein NI17_006115 [Thermobifida halotolerans]|uniref:Uncharacterized protein n=1 Tax=Thermobifida halotolerans TaxID=483545 RepID=A0A399G7X1_9ACTN|nr:hypothetical protein [Thermobifida halotolerans]UOE20769.1 hypothetical protein NI17_006115 [Thermobifida halotolerans]